MEAAKYYKNIKILYEDDHILVCQAIRGTCPDKKHGDCRHGEHS